MLTEKKKKKIMKLIGDEPVVMNVTIVADEPIKGAKPEGIFEKCNISYSERFQKECEKGNKTAVMK